MDENGSITPYLIITLTASLLILFMLIDFARIGYLKNETRRDAQLAISSELALYNKELKEEYGLFGCIKQEDFEVEDDVLELMNKNIDKTKVDGYEIKSVELIDELSLMDNEELERQINAFMKYRNIESNFEEIMNILSSSKEKQKEIKNEVLYPCTEEEYDEIESYKDRDNRDHAKSILNENYQNEDIVLPNDYDFKNEDDVNLDNITEKSEDLIDSYEVDISKNKIVNYSMLVFNNALNSKKDNHVFDAEIEFLITGSNTQCKNIKGTFQKIRMILLPERLAEVYMSDEKRAEAELIAQATCGWWSGEIGVTIAKNTILVSMAIEETESDLNALKRGESVKLLNILDVSLNYEEFLKVLLMFEDKDKILDRIRILIDANLKEVNGAFDITKVKTGMLFKITSKGKFIFTTSLPSINTKLNEFEYEENVFGVY